MKTTILHFILLLLIGLVSPLAAQQPCGNNCTGGQSGTCPTCPRATGNPSYDAYTGNAYRTITDLEVRGGVGDIPLRWQRFHNTRYDNAIQYLGTAGNWRHSYQWEMVSSGNNASGQAQITIYTPSGNAFLFTQVSPTQWNANTSVTQVLYQNGSNYSLQDGGGTVSNFTQLADGSFQLVNITDSQGYVTTFGYDASGLLSRVTEPAGRYLQISYQALPVTSVHFTQLARITTTPAAGTWKEIILSNPQPLRYVRYRGADNSRSMVAEVEFYDAAGNKLTGTAFGAGPATGSYSYKSAFDGKTSTSYSYGDYTGGYCGLDLGANAPAVAKIRYYPPGNGNESRMNQGLFEGANALPQTVPAIAQVSSSDGRSVSYAYQAMTDPTLPDLFQALISASYGDSTQAVYTYGQIFSSTRPLLMTANDPRYEGVLPRVKYKYFTGEMDSVGEIQQEINLVNGAIISTLGTSYSQHTPTVTYSNGAVINYTLTSGLLTSQKDALGNQTSYVYSTTSGYLISQTDPRGYKTTYTNDTLGRHLTQTNPDTSVERWTYDSMGLIATHTDELGRVTRYTRDASHRTTRIDYADLSYETFTYNSIDPVQHTYGQLVSHRLRNAASENFTYDARGLQVSKTDATGNITAYTYDTSDRLASETTPDHATTFLYTERGQPSTITSADTNFSSFTYDSYGNRLTSTNELGKTWTYEYDEFKRVISVTDPLIRKTSYSYGLPGGVCACSSPTNPVTSITLPSGKQTFMTYDLKWQKTSETKGMGTIDAATSNYSYDKADNLLTTTDPRGKAWTYTYDNRNRRSTATDPLLNKTQWTYDKVGNRLTETLPDAGVTTNVYDTMNRLTKTTDPKTQATQFAYDNADNLVSLLDARNNTYSFTYDAMKRKTRMTYPGGSYEAWTYHGDGHMATYRTRSGQTMTSSYDNRDRETLRDWDDTTPDVSTTYDPASRVTLLSTSVSQLSYTYDDANQLLSETQAVSGAPAHTISYAYDPDGNRGNITYPSGTAVAYAYTGRSQVASISADGPPPLATYSYDQAGNRIGKTLENGTSVTYGYDDASRLQSISHQQSNTSFASFGYTLNKVGNRTAKAITGSGILNRTETYGYDPTDQLTTVSYGTARNVTYAYDAVGNRTSTVDGSLTTPYTANTLNQYTGIDSLSTPVYSPNGNLTNVQYPGVAGSSVGAVWTYTYDSQNRLLTANNGTTSATIAYDARNRQVSRTINGTITYYIYDDWNLIEEYTSSGTLQARYVHGAQVDEILCKEDTGTSSQHYYHHDALGSVIALTDSTGNLIESYQYDAYGTPTTYNASGTILTTSTYNNRFLFTGREWLADLAIYDYRNRQYSPQVGRFLQTDPIGFDAGDINMYRYVENSANMWADPLGLCSIDVRLGHYTSYNKPDAERRRKNPKHCNRVGYIGCGANQLNELAGESGVPGMPKNNSDEYPSDDIRDRGKGYGLGPDDFTGPSEGKEKLDAGIKAAKKEAKEMCKSDTCCKKAGKVTINVDCQNGLNGFSDSRCGTKIIVPCTK